MHRSHPLARLTLALAATALFAVPAGATTLLRAGLDELVRGNELILQGRVLDVHSYWNADHTFILTDVRLRPESFLKGTRRADEDVTLTLPGGTVGETTVLLIGTPEMVPGSDYVVFLNREELPGFADRLTVRDLVQGVFEVASVRGQRRVFSQALGHPLLSDPSGSDEAVGGRDGLEFGDFHSRVRAILAGN